MTDTSLPDIVIRAADEDRLSELANSLLDSKPELAEELLGELARARLASGDALPPDSVQMGSTVTYEADGRRRTVTLVYPPEAGGCVCCVSILAPVGTALLGLSAGQAIEWDFPDGNHRRLRVDQVIHQDCPINIGAT